jgi:aspartate kinase
MEQVNTAGIVLRLKNVMNPTGSGTVIYPSTPSSSQFLQDVLENGGSELVTSFLQPKASFMTVNGYYGSANKRRTPTALTFKDGMTVLNVVSNGRLRPQHFLAKVSEVIERHGIAIDLISSSQQMLSLAVCSKNYGNVRNTVSQLENFGTVATLRNMAIVSVIGHKMRNMVGVSSEIFAALASAKVNVYLISQGASEINIS